MSRRLPYHRLSLTRQVRLLAFAALVLLLAPASQGARPHARAPRARQRSAPQARSADPRHHDRHARHIAGRPPAHTKAHFSKAALPIRFHPLRRGVSVTPRFAATLPKPDLRITSTSSIARSSFEASTKSLTPPIELSEMKAADVASSPASVPMPVVSIIRPTTDHPQLPSIEDVVATPAILPALYDKSGRLVVPPAMRGSREILLHQNEVADRDGLARVQDDSDLEWMRHRGLLVAVPVSNSLRVDDRLPTNRRYCRPWTAQFLTTLARAYSDRFHTPLQVNSAVRTVSFQQRLLRTNGNAAPAAGETASPHLTGQAIDLAKRGLSLSQIAWLRGYLLPLVQQGKIDVEEEFQQACFHISVYKSYGPTDLLPQHEIAVTHRDRPAALAIAIQ